MLGGKGFFIEILIESKFINKVMRLIIIFKILLRVINLDNFLRLNKYNAYQGAVKGINNG